MKMKIKHIWDRLSPATQKWLTDNPGCLVLPRTMTETICQETGVSADCDQHGQATLSRADPNVCDPNYTMPAKLPKWALKSAEADGGAHRRLRAAAEEYQAREQDRTCPFGGNAERAGAYISPKDPCLGPDWRKAPQPSPG